MGLLKILLIQVQLHSGHGSETGMLVILIIQDYLIHVTFLVIEYLLQFLTKRNIWISDLVLFLFSLMVSHKVTQVIL